MLEGISSWAFQGFVAVEGFCLGFFLPPLFAAIFITVSLFIPFIQRRIIVWIYGLPRATFPRREGARAG